ncbi:putative NADP-dependent alcohol hydrogenase [Leptomonas pyrrhocoris]|uniref:Putative NADP-dependent alcohol hydrogenase n=1 Tax=Leptomonas pyrrhocoris TaxID=157538 RepID=A0A0M9FQU7_LEPPY|nr:putative NADP-dependent alcohol hydrogenase [Leptomonas pyrrhocoris]KPA74133.1 putative NADP-dependent alcohol hydrogenase [Leptomonas pyrrhocoris]|eukprot:XP_015652572.1 putative NADP-dependent alcohol hydrogenase [Leptomonas pyrrhocoris]
MPSKACGWGAVSAKSPLQYMAIKRRDPRPNDVSIKIEYCGVCHSDLHTVRNEWAGTTFPMIPGHEIVGHVTAVGSKVAKYKVGDRVGVGCMVDSCLKCKECCEGLENYCANGNTQTYNSQTEDGMTMGGYTDHVVVREEFVLRIPDNLDLCAAAPLLCAGITTYSPLRHWGVKSGSHVGVVGLGGLGHMAVKLAHAMGAEVTVFTTSANKVEAAKQLGAHNVVISKDPAQMAAYKRKLDLIIDTVGTAHDLAPYVDTLKVDGTHVLVGAPEHPHPALQPFQLILARRSVAGSCIGGIAETQEMLDFCGKHNIVCDVEKIDISYINEAYERMLKSDVHYRFVIDLATLKQQ